LQYVPLLPVVTPRLWDEVLRGHYIIGLHRGWGERVVATEGDAS
jgi:hypothetical protein